MTDLVEFLYPAPARRRVVDIVKWWEKRRLPYNLIVGGAGLFSVTWLSFLQAIPPWSSPSFVPWQAVVAFGVMANICYTLGPTVEVLIQKLFKGQILPTGPGLFRMGLTFSVGLALFPALLGSIMWIVTVLATILGFG